MNKWRIIGGILLFALIATWVYLNRHQSLLEEDFKKFYGVEYDESSMYGDSGLGLDIVYQLETIHVINDIIFWVILIWIGVYIGRKHSIVTDRFRKTAGVEVEQEVSATVNKESAKDRFLREQEDTSKDT